jgi:hypothetical protein
VPQQRSRLRVFRVDHQLTPLDVFPLLLPPFALYSFHLCPPLLCDTLDLLYSLLFNSIYPFTSLHFHISHTSLPLSNTAHPVELETCNCIPIIHSLTTHPSRPASITHTTLLRDAAGFLCPDDRKNSNSRSKRKKHAFFVTITIPTYLNDYAYTRIRSFHPFSSTRPRCSFRARRDELHRRY